MSSIECERVAPVFEEYRTKLSRFIRSRVKDPVDSEELLSEILIKTYDHCEKLTHVRNMEAWLVTVAKNTILDYFREKNKIVYDTPELMEELESTSFHRLLEPCIPGLIERLPAKYADPLIDYEFKGIPQKVLAETYGLSESGLKSRVQRSRKMLKELFLEYCGLELEQQECRRCESVKGVSSGCG